MRVGVWVGIWKKEKVVCSSKQRIIIVAKTLTSLVERYKGGAGGEGGKSLNFKGNVRLN